MLHWAWQQGMPARFAEMAALAAEKCNLRGALHDMHHHECLWSEKVCSSVVADVHLEVVQWRGMCCLPSLGQEHSPMAP